MSSIDSNFEMLSRALDIAALRHKAIANNLANANTPGYRRLEVQFKQELDRVIHGRAPLDARIVESADPVGPNDNNVSFERELADLQKNALIYQTFAQLADLRMKGLRSAIQGQV